VLDVPLDKPYRFNVEMHPPDRPYKIAETNPNSSRHLGYDASRPTPQPISSRMVLQRQGSTSKANALSQANIIGQRANAVVSPVSSAEQTASEQSNSRLREQQGVQDTHENFSQAPGMAQGKEFHGGASLASRSAKPQFDRMATGEPKPVHGSIAKPQPSNSNSSLSQQAG